MTTSDTIRIGDAGRDEKATGDAFHDVVTGGEPGIRWPEVVAEGRRSVLSEETGEHVQIEWLLVKDEPGFEFEDGRDRWYLSGRLDGFLLAARLIG